MDLSTQQYFEKIERDWKNNQKNNGQVILLYILLCLQELAEKNFLQIKNKTAQKMPTLSLIENFDFIDTHLFFTNYSLRKIKEKAQLALAAILNNKFHVVLTEDVLAPYDLLKMQAQGKRVVGLHFDHKTRSQSILTKKNGLHFAIHDLEHAWEFFHDSKLYQIQIGTFRLLLKLEQDSFFKQLKDDTELRERYFYLIIDMNTHWGHTLMFMQALLLDHCKKTETSINIYHNLFTSILRLDDEQRNAFQRLWTRSTTQIDEEIIESFVLELAKQEVISI
jgi:hypothetical protein